MLQNSKKANIKGNLNRIYYISEHGFQLWLFSSLFSKKNYFTIVPGSYCWNLSYMTDNFRGLNVSF